MPLKWIAGASTILILVFGVWKIEDRYATAGGVAKEIIKLQEADQAQTLEVKALKDGLKYEKLQKRIWLMDDKYGIGCAECPPEILMVYREDTLEKLSLEE